MLTQVIGAAHAPRFDMQPFDGNPLHYHAFMRCFEETVEKHIACHASRLTRLINLCTDEAACVLRGCTTMPTEDGYRNAKDLLHARFFNQYMIANMWIRQLTDDTHETLKEYADNLRACYLALNGMGNPTALDSVGELGKLVAKLPQYVQNRWKTQACKQRRTAGPPTLQDVVKLAEAAASEESEPVTLAARHYREERSGSMASSRQSRGGNRRSPTKKYNFNIPSTSSNDRCAICEGHHYTGTSRTLADAAYR